MSFLYSLLTIPICLAFGCGNSGSNDDSFNPDPNPQPDLNQNHTRFVDHLSTSDGRPYPLDEIEILLNSISEKLVKLNNSCRPNYEDLSQDKFPETCKVKEYKFIPAKLDPESRGKRIAIMDRDMLYTGFTRYPNQIIGMMKQDPNSGIFIERNPTYTMPVQLMDILEQIYSHGTIPSTYLFSYDMNKLIKKYLSPLKRRHGIENVHMNDFHGNPILVKLLELIPKAQILLIQTPTSYGVPKDIFCRLNTQEGLDSATEFLDNEYQSLKAMFNIYKLDYINQSYATSRADISSWWDQQCSDSGDLPSSMADTFYSRLTQHNINISNIHKNLVVFKATSGGNYLHGHGDCVVQDNFVRVNAAFSYGSERIPLTGSSDYFRFPGAADRRDCTDLFIALDRGDTHAMGEFAIDLNQWGLKGDSLEFSLAADSSSYANPVAISYFISIREEAKKYFGKDHSTREVLKYGTMGGNIVAPARYSLLPFCRQYSGVCRYETPFWEG